MKKPGQSGMVSIMVSLIMMIVITLIVVGFAEVARRNAVEALDRQLSAQAFYAAETGINDAKSAIDNGLIDPSTPSYKTQCGAAITDLKIKESNPTIDVLNPSNRVSYTCLLVDNTPPTYQVQLGLGEVKVAQLKMTPPPDGVSFSWPNSGSGNLGQCPNDAKTFKVPSQWVARCEYGVLRADIYADQGTTDPINAANHTVTVFMVPQNGGSVSQTLDFTPPTSGSPQRTYAVPANCDNSNCKAILKGFTGPSYYVRFTAIYEPISTITIQGDTTPTKFTGGVTVIDVTGKAQDVIRRIQVRYTPPKPTLYPMNAIQSSGDICKHFSIAPGTSATPDFSDDPPLCG